MLILIKSSVNHVKKKDILKAPEKTWKVAVVNKGINCESIVFVKKALSTAETECYTTFSIDCRKRLSYICTKINDEVFDF